MKTISIEITETGEIKVEAGGFTDKSCLDALKEIEKHLGTATDIKLKPEGHRNATGTSERNR